MSRLSMSWCLLILFELCLRAQTAPQGANAAVGRVAAGGAGVSSPAVGVAPSMIMPIQPVPPGVCVEDGATGFVNDTCQTDSDCYDSGSGYTCVSKRCQCAKNYVEDASQSGGAKRRVCVPLPSFFSPCTEACQKPFECKSGAPMVTGVAAPPAPPDGGKTCQCPGKSRYTASGYCDAGCKNDQRIGKGGECVSKCTKDQILIDNECESLADIGERCTDNVQCKAAFSSCQSGKCACQSGFSAQGSKCQPTTYSCPFGDPLKKGGSTVLCDGAQAYPVCTGNMCPMAETAMGGKGAPPVPPKAAMVGNANADRASMPIFAKPYKTDSCPSTHYCYTYDFSGPGGRGHCCPKPAQKCPVGEPHPTGSCIGGANTNACPFITHTCLSVGAPADYTSQLCCPKACQGYDKVFVKDQCLPTVQYGDGCQYNEQCAQLNGICSGGKCTCGPKATAVDIGGPNKYCQLACGGDEIPFGSECKSRQKLGDSCTPDGAFCPSGAYCNSKGVCACVCGYQKLNEKFCAPPPFCPGQTPGAPSTPSDPKKLTFCKLDGDAKPPISAVDSCPAKFFCSGYVENVGVCCPQPDPFCPDGSKPTSKRSCHNNEQTCGANEMCNIYYTSATNRPGGVPQQGSVCCPISEQPMPVPLPMPVPVPMAASAGGGVASTAETRPIGK